MNVKIKFVAIAIAFVVAAGCFFFLINKRTSSPDIRLEFITIGKHDSNNFKSTLDQLKPIHSKCFEGLLNAHYHLTDKLILQEKVALHWFNSVESFAYPTSEVAAKNAIYFVVARDEEARIMGFAVGLGDYDVHADIESGLKRGIVSIVSGSVSAFDKNILKENTLYLWTLAVSPDFQRHGVGRSLIFSFFCFLPHLKRIVLATADAQYNYSVKHLYEKCGFKEVMLLKENNGYVKKIYQFIKD